jgi:hypothetical protein
MKLSTSPFKFLHELHQVLLRLLPLVIPLNEINYVATYAWKLILI